MIRPTRGVMLGELLPIEELTQSGLYKVSRQTKPQRAKITAVGDPGIDKKGREIKPYAEVGQVVYIRKNYGKHMHLYGKDMVFLKNEDVCGKY